MHGLILGINGSPRKDGIGAFLLKQALDAAEKENFFTHLLHLGDYNIPYCDGDYTDKTPTGLEMLFSMIERADGIIFASPVHYFNVSGRMKSLIDHLTVFEFRGESDGYALCGKVAGCIATCEEDGGQMAVSAMAGPLNHMGFIIPPQCMFFHNTKIAEKSEDAWMMTDAALVGKRVATMVQRMGGYRWDV